MSTTPVPSTTTIPLPDAPDIDQLKTQAKEFLRSVRAGDPAAVALVTAFHSSPRAAASLALSGAQLVVARRHGFTSWPALRAHVAVITTWTRFPEADAAAVGDEAEPVDRFLRLACLNYGNDDGPQRFRLAAELLAAHLDLPSLNICVAAACADVDAVNMHIEKSPNAASALAGPMRWEPLLYLAYARHDPDMTADAVVATVDALLRAGADPDAGYLWHGMTSPFTALTGAFGHGELGIARQPPHAQQVPLATALLAGGADPNDDQALYNRQFDADDTHLEVLFRHGLGRARAGAWWRRLGTELAPLAEMIGHQLAWAVLHDQRARVALLAANGIDITAPLPDGRLPADVAATCGYRALVAQLVALGATPPAIASADSLIGAILAADADGVAAIVAAEPGVVDELRAIRPGLVVWAAAQGQPGSVALAIDLGFDVNALARSDVPIEQAWETALHVAANSGDEPLARLLLERGADPDVRDRRFEAPPLGWARHADQPALVALLESVTSEAPSSTSSGGSDR